MDIPSVPRVRARSAARFLATCKLILFCLFFSACAKPKYLNPIPQTIVTPQSGEALSCDLIFSSSGRCLVWFWEKLPTASEKGSLIFKVFHQNAFDQSVVLEDLDSPNILLWMPVMAHGSVPITITRLDLGTYRASNVFFVMPGDWEIHFQSKQGEEVKDEVVVDFTL